MTTAQRNIYKIEVASRKNWSNDHTKGKRGYENQNLRLAASGRDGAKDGSLHTKMGPRNNHQFVHKEEWVEVIRIFLARDGKIKVSKDI